jgi:hypothetical protein
MCAAALTPELLCATARAAASLTRKFEPFEVPQRFSVLKCTGSATVHVIAGCE